MQDKFLKARIPRELYNTLQQRAGEAGVRLGTHVREVLERDAQAMNTEQALARIEAALTTLPASSALASVPARDHDLHRELQELRLIVRELAMHANAQILTRVAAQLAAQGGAP